MHIYPLTSSFSSFCSQIAQSYLFTLELSTPLSCSCSSYLFRLLLFIEHPVIVKEEQCIYCLLADSYIILLLGCQEINKSFKQPFGLSSLLRLATFLQSLVSFSACARELPSTNNVGLPEERQVVLHSPGTPYFCHLSLMRQTHAASHVSSTSLPSSQRD